MASFKIPESVLVVIHTPTGEVLLLERADHPGFWQSITGSRTSSDEPLRSTCSREIAEETGLAVGPDAFDDWELTHRYAIYPQWRHRYAPGVTHNTEHVFGLLVPEPVPVRLADREHLSSRWLPWDQAAPACFSWSNAEAIRSLPMRHAGRG
jgi:dATP pyrophosphohydrolase